MNFFYPAVIILTAALTAAADYLIKIAADKGSFSNIYFITGSIFYLLTAIAWFYVVKNHDLYSSGILYDMTVILLLCIIGILFLGEKINVYSFLGIICAIASIIFMYKA